MISLSDDPLHPLCIIVLRVSQWWLGLGESKLSKMENQAYTIAEVADLTGFSRQTVTRVFERERGVLIVGRSNTEKDKRSYRSIRIPSAVYERVVNRFRVK